MNQSQNTLALKDIHLPEPISWWPPAPGWWLLFALAALLSGTVFIFRKIRKRSALKRAALNELKKVEATFAQTSDAQALVRDLSLLLRRICLSRYPRQQSAGLTEDTWLQLLDATLPNAPFSQGPGKVLVTAPYTRQSAVDADALLCLCRRWIQALPAGQQKIDLSEFQGGDKQ